MPSVKKYEAWPLSEAKARLSELVRLAQKEPQRIQINGDLAGAFISEKDLELLLELKKQRTKRLLQKLIKASEEEGIHAEDFGELRTTSKEVDLK